jgi:hypothetical protein
MADENLSVKVTLDSGDVSSKLDELSTRVSTLEASFKTLASGASGATAAITEHGEAHGKASEKVKETASATEALGAKLGALSGSTALAADALEQLGIESGNASASLRFLGEAIEKIGDTAPLLLAVGAAVASLAAGFLVLKDGIDEAAASQRDLVSIGVLIKNQGGDWQETTKAVGEYSETLAKAGVESRGAILEGMQQMLVAGVSANDMMRSQVAAQDLAIAKNESLVEAETQLAMAYDGRMREFQRLGIVTKAEVEAGIPYEELLSRIEERMGSAAASALDTYAGKQQNLANNFNALVGQIGGALLPVMSDWVDMLRLVVNEAAPVTDLFVKWINTHLPELREGIDAFGRAFGDLVGTALPPFLKAMEDVMLGMARLGDWIVSNEETIRDFFFVVLAGGALKTMDAFGQMVPAVIAGLVGIEGELGAVAVAEAFATLGMSLFVTGGVLMLADLLSHWQQTTDDIKGDLTDLQTVVGTVTSAIQGFFDGIAQSYQNFLDAMRQSIPVIGQIASAVQSYYQARADGEKKFDDYEKAKSVVGGGPAAGIMGGAAAPLGGSALAAGAGTFSGGWGTGALTASDFSNASFGSYDGPPATSPSPHQIPGTAKPKSGGNGEAFQPPALDIAMVDSFTAAQKGLEEALKHVDDAEKLFADDVKLATTAQSMQKAQADADAQSIIDLESKQKMLTEATKEEARELAGMHALQVQSTLDYESAREAYSAYGTAHKDGSKQTAAEKNELADLKTTMDGAHKTMEDYTKVLDTLKANLDKNTESLANVKNALADFTTKTAESLASAEREWEAFQIKTASAYGEQVETLKMTNAQKVTYYGNTLDQMRALDVAYQAQYIVAQSAMVAAEKSGDDARIFATVAKYEEIARLMIQNLKDSQDADGKEVAANKAALDEIQKAYEKSAADQKKLVDEETKTVDDFLNAIVLKHKSLGDELKSIYQQIEQSFLSMVSGMVTGSSGFQKAMGELGIGGSSSSQPGGGLFSGILGAAGGGASVTAPKGTAADPLNVVLADSSPTQLTKMTGSSTGVFPGSATYDQNTTSVGSGYGSNSSIPNINASALQTSISDAISGAVTGGLVSSLTGGNATGSSLGGALGGVAGAALHANPLIGAGIDIVGSLIGGLFGNHETPAQQPDVSEPTYGTNTSYGQFTANWQGAPVNAGGNAYNPSSQYYTGIGGTSEAQDLLTTLKSTLAPNSGAAPTLVAEAQQLQALTNGDTASNALNITGEKQGMYTLGSGAQVSVQNFMQMVSQFMTNSGGSAGAIPTFNISRDYQNANASTLAAAGTTPGAGIVMGTGAVVVNVAGSIVGSNGITQLATTIGQVLYQQGRGTLPVGSRTTLYNTPGAGF